MRASVDIRELPTSPHQLKLLGCIGWYMQLDISPYESTTDFNDV